MTGRSGGDDAVPGRGAGLDGLGERLREPDPEARREALAALAVAVGALAPEARERLAEQVVPALADDDEQVRDAAVALLSRLPDATEVLRAFLSASRGLAPFLRERARECVLRVVPDVSGPLACLAADPDEDVRGGALSLAACCAGDERVAAAAIRAFRGGGDWWIRSIAAETLARFPSPEATEALLGGLDDADLRPSVVAALGKMTDPRAGAALVGLLADADRGTRAAALEALGGHEGPEVLEALLGAASGDADGALRAKAAAALEARRPASEAHLRRLAEAAEVASPNVCAEGEPLCMEGDGG